jgi:hypothetical protein
MNEQKIQKAIDLLEKPCPDDCPEWFEGPYANCSHCPKAEPAEKPCPLASAEKNKK